MANDEFVRVPRVPTGAMIDAGIAGEHKHRCEHPLDIRRRFSSIYEAMLAAIEPESAQTEGEIDYSIPLHTICRCPQCGAGKDGV